MRAEAQRRDTYAQKCGHEPGKRPPESPVSQVLRYGDRTARGMAGGCSGKKEGPSVLEAFVEARAATAPVTAKTRMRRRRRRDMIAIASKC